MVLFVFCVQCMFVVYPVSIVVPLPPFFYLKINTCNLRSELGHWKFIVGPRWLSTDYHWTVTY